MIETRAVPSRVLMRCCWTELRPAGAGLLGNPRVSLELLAVTMWAGIHGEVSVQIAFAGDQWTAWCRLEQRVGAMLTVLTAKLFKDSD